MSTYRERRLAKAERLREWADKREAKAAALHAQNEPYRGDIAFNTQPGHIPERARAIARTERAFAHTEKANDMARRAAGIEAAADAAIYSDDPDAIERLAEKVATLEAKRARIKAYNASCRKGARDVTILTDAEQRDLASVAKHAPYQLRENGAAPAYWLTNLGGTITTTRKRLDQLKRKATDQ